MNSPVEEIKSRLDIVEFIQGYLRLQKAGVNFRANCPFHGEKTPSFFVTPTRQIWHCFGCGKGGDIFAFAMEMEGLDFSEALKMLAMRAGVVLVREDPRISSERSRLYDVNEAAAVMFQYVLSQTPAAQEYALGRGLTEETIKKFRIGFSPQSWDFLLKNLIKKGFTKEEIERAGLAIQSQDGSSWYDRFRSRIMFPITDFNGRVIGFGGRIFMPDPKQATSTDKTEAKYINTPQTMIYDKSSVLYGFDKAKQEIRAKNRVVIVEGYMDCIMSHQAGVLNTIAVSGTALTPQQLKALRRLCETIVCSFDTDAAGESATRRSLALASEFDFDRLVAAIPSGKDPADTVVENPVLWQDAVMQAKPVVDFYVAKAFFLYNPATPEGKKEIAAMVLPFVDDLSDAIQRDHWIKELAARLEVTEDAIVKEMNRRREGQSSYDRNEADGLDAPAETSGRRERLEKQFLALMACMPEKERKAELKNDIITFRSATNQNLFSMLTEGAKTVGKDQSLSPVPEIEMLTFRSEIMTEDVKDLAREFIVCKREFEKECVKEKLAELGDHIKRCEREGNQQAVAEILQDFLVFSEKLKHISTT